MPNPIFVRTLRAHEEETVEIQWQLTDGRVHIERYTVPPRSVIDAKLAQETIATAPPS